MFGPRFRRAFVFLVLALAMMWPVAMPLADLVHASRATTVASTPMTDGCRDCDHAPTGGACPAVFCAVPPAVLPAPAPDHADAAGRSVPFILADERGHGRVPGVAPPPPKASPPT
jgi:hypothetical protein